MVENKQQSTDATLSDRRARRKAKRGEPVTQTSATVSSDQDSLSDTDTVINGGKGVATRKQRDAIRERERGSQTVAERVPMVGGVASYLRNVWAEMQKVTWPTQEEAQRLTVIVVVVTTIFALFLGALDLFYGWWFQEGLSSTATFLAVGVPVMAIALFISWMYIIREPS